MRNALFLFGSFSQGMIHFKKIEGSIRIERSAVVRGSVYRLPSGVPAFSSDGLQTISGSLVELDNHEFAMSLLDQFHGIHRADPEKGLFFRETLQAFLDDGSVELAEAYCLNLRRLPRGARLIEDGNWRGSLEASPPLLQRLTERQRTYIQKLGSSSSRDIVPIDLALYRELLHLEIVVDKGRRLALTPLGHEIYRFLS